MNKTITICIIGAVFAASFAFGQTATPTTTAASAVAMTDRTINLASSTGVTAAGLGPVTGLYVDREFMTVVDNPVANRWTVKRGVAGVQSAHLSGATVYVAPLSAFDLGPRDRSGTCTASNFQYLPLVNVRTGNGNNCIGGQWQVVSLTTSIETVRATAQFDAVTGTTGATLTNVTGMSVSVVPGVYRFYVNLPGVATGNSGIKAGFKYTTTALTSIESTARIFTASGVAVQHSTTATDQASLAASTTAAISTIIEGTMVVATGGTIQLQAAQNAAHADTTSVYVGATMTFTRISN